MKKTYLKPVTQQVCVGVHQMICGSDRNVNISPNETVSDINSLQSRRGSDLWDDED